MLGDRKEVCFSVLKEWRMGCSQKEDFPSYEPGPWTCTVCHTSGGEIIDTVSQENWEKTRALVTEIITVVAESADIQEQEYEVAVKMRKQMEDASRFSDGAKISQQRLLEIQGFLNYVVRTYAWLAQYAKGVHNTIDGWRYDCNSGGWKLRGKHLQTMLA